jgi:cell division protein FtsQ
MTQRTSTSRASRSVGRSSAPTPLARRSPPRRSKLRLGLVVLLVFALAAGAIWVVFWSSLLATRNVEVVGTSRLSTADVMAAASVPLGQPLARLDTAEVRVRVAELAPVESVDVARVLPGTVRLDVVERTPIAVLPGSNGLELVDAYGVRFAAVAERPAGLPLVEAESDRGSQAGIEVASQLPADLRTQVEMLRATTSDDVTLQLPEGVTVLWGSSADSERKTIVLRALLTQPASVYDVSAPDAPVTRQ